MNFQNLQKFTKFTKTLGRVANSTLSSILPSLPPQGCNCVNETLCVTYSIDMPNLVKNSKNYTHGADVTMQPRCMLFDTTFNVHRFINLLYFGQLVEVALGRQLYIHYSQVTSSQISAYRQLTSQVAQLGQVGVVGSQVSV